MAISCGSYVTLKTQPAIGVFATVISLNGLIIMLKRPFCIYIMALLFVSGGFIVATNHHHCKDLCDVSSLQVYCQYLKNPIGKHSIPSIVIFLLPFSIIYFHLAAKRRTIYTIELDSFKNQYLIFLSAFPYRAPPNS